MKLLIVVLAVIIGVCTADKPVIDFTPEGNCLVDGVEVKVGETILQEIPCARSKCQKFGISGVGCPLMQGPRGYVCEYDDENGPGLYPDCCPKLRCIKPDGSRVVY